MNNGSTETLADRLLESIVSRLSPESARMLVEHQPPADVQTRLDELAARSFQDELTPEEKDEYEGAVLVVQALALFRYRILTRPQGEERLGETARPAHRIDKAVTLDATDRRLDGLEAMLEDMDV